MRELSKKTKQIFSWVAVAFYAATIFTLSSMSHPLPHMALIEKKHIDKLLHMTEYTIFSILLFKALSVTLNIRSAVKLTAIVFAVGILYAASDEWHQSFVPCRDCDVHDAMADGVGLLMGAQISAALL